MHVHMEVNETKKPSGWQHGSLLPHKSCLRVVALVPDYKTFVGSDFAVADPAQKLPAAPLQQGAENTEQQESRNTEQTVQKPLSMVLSSRNHETPSKRSRNL